MTATNPYYENTFSANVGTLAQSAAVARQYTAIQRAFDLIKQAVDGINGADGITDLEGFPASFEGQALKYLRVNAEETAIDFVAGARLTIKTISATSYTVLPTDAGSLLIFTATSPVTVNVDSGTLAQGDVVCLRQGAAGQVTVSPGSGVTIQSSDSLYSTRTQGAQIALVSDDGAAQFGLIGERNAPSLGVALLAQANIFTKGQTVTPVALTDAATVNTDASLSNTFTLTIGGNRTLANPTNLQNGQVLNWLITQDGTGSRTLAYGSLFKWPGGSAPVLSTTAGARDHISGQYFSGPNIIVASIVKGLA